MNRRKWSILTFIAVVCLLAAGGGVYSLLSEAGADPVQNRLRLGTAQPAQYLQGTETVTLDQLELTLGYQSYPDGYISIPNHSETLWKRPVKLPAGEGQLIKFVQGGSAVFPAPDTTYFWACIQRPALKAGGDPVTYYLEAKVLGGDEDAAEESLLQLAENWEVPE
ncbi:hypothetical protein [Paenibacillus sp. MMS20-IR301]|uniref:hypothetical protein n=1 Tax=Paenibacillus sp. MMS20-IR301 TaxID=2895946 RepID=UPI0028E84D3E|nr:hypothetical protein [Paenibacillus sp. MMS20-IR301]WNS45907.1 hypothetical protein LOS79_11735 [Paenibacillus sp. MMS20-IR301]